MSPVSKKPDLGLAPSEDARFFPLHVWLIDTFSGPVANLSTASALGAKLQHVNVNLGALANLMPCG